MPFDFSCVHCGKHLTQDQVLFDMSKMFLETKDSSFQYLRFRLTAPELKELFDKGDTVDGHLRRRKIKLSLSKVMSYMEREHNMPGLSLGWLNLKEIEYFLSYRKMPYVADPEEQGADESGTEELAAMGKEERAQRKLEREAWIAQKKAAHEARLKPFEEIVTRQSDGQKSADHAERLEYLAADLEKLKVSFNKDTEQCQMYLELDEQKTEMGDTIISGWRFYSIDALGRPGEPRSSEESRLCPDCLGDVFEGAGTAQHRTVVFLGSQGTGKTSAILAVTHLLRYYGSSNAQGRIWNGIKLYEFLERKMCSPSNKMRSELAGYGRGVAPAKTDTVRVGASAEMHKAYSSTFKLVAGDNRITFLSLLDAPGEICKENGSLAGEIDGAMIEKHFQVVLSSDAYVLCFEHPEGRKEREKRAKELEKLGVVKKAPLSPEEEGEPKMEPPQMVCEWAEKIQGKRKSMYEDQGIEVGYIPMLLLFTKCPELEVEDAKDECGDQVAKNDFYMFPAERNAIKKEQDFTNLLDSFNRQPELKEAFFAQLRCSPYGFQSTSEADQKILNQEGRQEAGNMTPAPQNVEKLLEWILNVTASVPVDLSSFGMGKTHYLVPPENRDISAYEKYLLCGGTPVPCEGWDFFWNWNKQRPYMPVVRVAALRGRLFDNIKPYDRDLLRYRNDPVQMKQIWKKKKAENLRAEEKAAKASMGKG